MTGGVGNPLLLLSLNARRESNAKVEGARQAHCVSPPPKNKEGCRLPVGGDQQTTGVHTLALASARAEHRARPA